MDRNLWIRIQATGAEQAGAAVRRVGQEMRTLGREVKTSAQTVRAGTQMVGTSIAKTYSAIPNAIRTASVAVGAASRSIGQSLSQTFQSAGILKSGAQGPSALSNQLMVLRTQAAASLGAVKQQFMGVGSTIRGATRQWAQDVRVAGTMVMSSAQGAFRTAFNTVRVNALGTANIIKGTFQSTVASLRPISANILEMADKNAQASHTIGLALAALGGGIVFSFTEAFKAAANFQQEMQNVDAVIQKSPALIASLSKQVIELSRTLPQSPQKLAEGLYEIAQAGFLGQKAFTVLRAAAQAASAGLTDTVTASRGLIAILSAYGYNVNKSKYISDVLFQTVKVGIVTFEELSQQIGDFVGFAAAAGIKIEDLGIAMATMTRAGIPAAEASTSLNRVIQAIVKPSVNMREEMTKLGLSVDSLRDPSIGLIGVIQRLQHATGGNIVQLQKMFREIRAARGAYALMADNGKLLVTVMRQFGGESKINGQTLKALERQSKSFNYQWKLMENQFTAVAIQVGSQLLPVMTKFVKIIGAVVEWFSKLPGPLKFTIAGMTALVGVLVLTAGALFLIAPQLVRVQEGLRLMGAEALLTSRAVRIASASLGIVSTILVVASLAFTLFGRHQQKNIEINDDYSRSVRDTGRAISDAGKAAIANDLADKGLVEYMKHLHISAGLAINSIQGVDGAQQDFFTNVATSIQSTAPQVAKFLSAKDWDNLKKGLNGNTTAMDAFNSSVARFEFASSGKGGAVLQVTKDQKDALSDLGKVLAYVTMERAKTAKALKAYNDATGLSTKNTNNLTTQTQGLSDAQQQLATQQGQLTDTQKGLNELFKSVTSPADAYSAAADALKPLTTLTGVYSDKLQEEQKQIDAAASVLSRKHNQALTDATNAARDAAKQQSRVAADHLSAISAIAKRGSGLTAIVRQQGKDSTRAAQDAATNTARANAKLRSVTADYKRDAQVTITQYLGALKGAANDQQTYYDNVSSITKRGFGDLAANIADGSKESAGLLQLLAVGTDKQLKKVQDYYKRLGPNATQSFQQFITQLQKKAQDFATVNANITKLVASGRKDLVDLITTSDLSPVQQAALINEAATKSKKGLDKLQELLAQTAVQGDESFSVLSDTMATVTDNIIQHSNDLKGAVSFNDLFTKYKKLTGDTQTTADQFEAALRGMGGAIHDLPQNVQVIVAAFVNGQDKIVSMKNSLDDLKTSLEGVDSQVAKNALGTIGGDIQADINATSVTAKASFKAVSIAASIVNISTGKLNTLPRADGAITAYVNGGVRAEPSVSTVTSYVNGGVRTASNATSHVTSHVHKSSPVTSYVDGGVRAQSSVNNVTSNVSGSNPVTFYVDGGVRTSSSVRNITSYGSNPITSYADGGVRSKSSVSNITSYVNGAVNALRVNAPEVGPITAYVNGGVNTRSSVERIFTSHTATTSVQSRANGGVTSYASGSTLPKRAVIEKPKRGLIQWAEPETGGEAFIPLAKSKRTRSLSILGTVADTFGYSLVPEKMGSGGVRYPVEVNTEPRPMAKGGVETVGAMGTKGIRHVQPAAKTSGGNGPGTTVYQRRYEINGPIMPANLNEFERDLDRRSRLSALAGGSDND